jgi:hypothetical protein
MSLTQVMQYAKRKNALLKAKCCFGTVQALCNAVNSMLGKLEKFLKRAQVSRWLNEPERESPYQYCVLISYLTGVPLEHLSPFTEGANNLWRALIEQNQVLIQLLIDNHIEIPSALFINKMKFMSSRSDHHESH